MWLDDDYDAALEYYREKALECAGCGHPLDETMDPDAEGSYKVRVLRCHACAAKETEQRRLGDQPHRSEGLRFAVERDRS